MKTKLAMALMTAVAFLSLAGCAGRAYYVGGPPYPHAWVGGHYGPRGYWVPGHYR